RPYSEIPGAADLRVQREGQRWISSSTMALALNFAPAWRSPSPLPLECPRRLERVESRRTGLFPLLRVHHLRHLNPPIHVGDHVAPEDRVGPVAGPLHDRLLVGA